MQSFDEFFARGKAQNVPPPGAQDRVRHTLLVSIAAGAVPGAAAAAASKSTLTLGVSAWLKMGIAALVLSTGSYWYVESRPRATSEATRAARAHEHGEAITPTLPPLPGLDPVMPPDTASPEPSHEPVQPTRSRAVTARRQTEPAHAVVATNESPSEPTPSVPIEVADELRILHAAERALRSGDATDALQILAPLRGSENLVMHEERDALQARARCRLATSNEERSRIAQEFLRQHAVSPSGPRVRDECANQQR